MSKVPRKPSSTLTRRNRMPSSGASKSSGEATAHLTEETRRAIPQLSFRKMRGKRNIVAHDYTNVDAKIVWEVATIHVPEVCSVLEKFFAEQK